MQSQIFWVAIRIFVELKMPLKKHDFRFADDEDPEDISGLVNAAFAVEQVGRSTEVFAFRTKAKVDIDELRAELIEGRTKWVVLETPVPVRRLHSASPHAVGGKKCVHVT